MRQGGGLGVLLVCIIGFSHGAVAQTLVQQSQRCLANDPDLRIGGCTALIQSGLLTQGNLSSAFYNRGVAYDNKGQYDRAIQDYDQAIRLNPNFADAFNNRGNAYTSKGQFDRAIEDYDQAIRLNPQNAIPFYNRGNSYGDKGQYDRAIQDYDQAIRLNPKVADAFINRGDSYGLKGQYDRAIRDYDQAIRLDPNYANAFANRGRVWLKLGRPAEAILDYNAALRIDSKIARAFYGRGLAEQTSDAAKSASDILSALAIDPQVAGEYAVYGLSRLPPTDQSADATTLPALNREILEALEKTPEYHAIAGLHARNTGNDAWLKSPQGIIVGELLRLMRADAAAVSIVGPKDAMVLEYSIGGHKIPEENIRISDLENDPSYRVAVTALIGHLITESAQVGNFLKTAHLP